MTAHEAHFKHVDHIVGELESHIEKSMTNLPIDPQLEEGIRACLTRGAELLGIPNIWSDDIENEIQEDSTSQFKGPTDTSSTKQDQEQSSSSENGSSDEINEDEDLSNADVLDEIDNEMALQKDCLVQFEKVMLDYETFVSNFTSQTFEDDDGDEEKAADNGDGDISTNKESQNKSVTQKMLATEQEKSTTLDTKFSELCELEGECLTEITNPELRQSLEDKFNRVRELQRKEKEEIVTLRDDIKKHLDLDAKLTELNAFEDNLYSMDTDIKEISRILKEEIATSFPEIENTFANLAINDHEKEEEATEEEAGEKGDGLLDLDTTVADLPDGNKLWDSNWALKDDNITLRQVMDEETSSGIFSSTSMQPCPTGLSKDKSEEDVMD